MNLKTTLTFDIWTEVVKYLDFRDLVSLRLLSSHKRHLVALEYRRRIKYVMRHWISEDCQESFWRELQMGDGAICGSAVLKVLIPSVLFLSSATVLDIFVARDKGQELKSFLFSIGYEVSNVATPRLSINRQVGRRWLLYSPQIRKTIHILESKTPMMISGIVGSATSAHMSFITPRFIWVLYPSHLDKRIAVSMVAPLDRTTSVSLLYKGIKTKLGAGEVGTGDHLEGAKCILWQPNVGGNKFRGVLSCHQAFCSGCTRQG